MLVVELQKQELEPVLEEEEEVEAEVSAEEQAEVSAEQQAEVHAEDQVTDAEAKAEHWKMILFKVIFY